MPVVGNLPVLEMTCADSIGKAGDSVVKNLTGTVL